METSNKSRGRELTLDEIKRVLSGTISLKPAHLESWLRPYHSRLIKAAEDGNIIVELSGRSYHLKFDRLRNEYIVMPVDGFVPMARFRLHKIREAMEVGTL